MILLPTNRVFRRFVGSFCFKSLHERCRLVPIGSQRAAYNAPYTREFAAWVVGQETNRSRKNYVAPRRRTPPFLMEQKPAPCAPSFRTNPKGSVAVVQMPPHVDTASFGDVPVGRGKAKLRWFSKSKSVCAGWSGKVPRLCAIWTPQCGGVKGKLCFIKRKGKDLVSSYRRFCEKNVSIFENREKSNKNLRTFFRNAPSFLFFLSAFFEKTPVPSPTMTLAVSSSAPPYARTDTPLRIAHSASSQFLPSPFTFTRNLLIQCVLRVKEMLFFCLHW